MQDEIKFHQIICTNISRKRVISGDERTYETNVESRTAKILHMDANDITNLYGKPHVMIVVCYFGRGDFNSCRALRFDKTKGTVFVTILEGVKISEWREAHNITCTRSEYEFHRLTRTFNPTRVYTVKYHCGDITPFTADDFIFEKLLWRNVVLSDNYDPFKPKEVGKVEVGNVADAEVADAEVAPQGVMLPQDAKNPIRRVMEKHAAKKEESSSDEESDEPLEKSDGSEE